MLRKQTHRVVTIFAADFIPKADFQSRLPIVAASIERSLDKSLWSAKGHQFTFRSELSPLVAVVTSRRLQLQTLGYNEWADHLSKHGDLIREALDAYGVSQLKRIGFSVQCGFDLQMSNAEQRALLFGTFLRDKKDYPSAFGDLDDALIHFEGNIDKYRYHLDITPQTTEQSDAQVRGMPNRQAFVLPNGDLTPDLVAMQENVGELFQLAVDLFAQDQSVTELRSFLTQSLATTEGLVTSALRLFKYLP